MKMQTGQAGDSDLCGGGLRDVDTYPSTTEAPIHLSLIPIVTVSDFYVREVFRLTVEGHSQCSSLVSELLN